MISTHQFKHMKVGMQLRCTEFVFFANVGDIVTVMMVRPEQKEIKVDSRNAKDIGTYYITWDGVNRRRFELYRGKLKDKFINFVKEINVYKR